MQIDFLGTKIDTQGKPAGVSCDADFFFTVSGTGVVLVDRTTGTTWRLYIDNGVLNLEQVQL